MFAKLSDVPQGNTNKLWGGGVSSLLDSGRKWKATKRGQQWLLRAYHCHLQFGACSGQEEGERDPLGMAQRSCRRPMRKRGLPCAWLGAYI